MRFGPIPTDEAGGAIAAHTLRLGDLVVRKGSTISAATAADLKARGVEEVVAARLDATDVGEDEAARRLARAVAGAGVRVEPPFTGRVNLFAQAAGLLRLDADRVDGVNAVDESLTIATLPAWKPVVAGEMVATVKIIPYGVPSAALEAAVAAVRGREIVQVLPWRVRRVGVISTLLPGLKERTVAKTLEALSARLAPPDAAIVGDMRCHHDVAALTAALRDLAASTAEILIVFGASAIADRRDVIPAAIEAAGGTAEHFGMPVDPGNLLLIGRIGDKAVIGAPGCARSPKENGFDWVLHRLLAGVPVTRADVTRLGVGGLLMEIVSRGQPRAGGAPDDDA